MTTLAIKLKIFPWRRQLELLHKLVRTEDSVCFSRAPSRGNIFYTLGCKHKRLAIGARASHQVLVDEALDMELPKDELFSALIKAYQSPVFVHLSFGILCLRFIH